MPDKRASRTDPFPEEMRALERRDLELSITSLVMILAVAAGFTSLLMPKAMWDLNELRVEGQFLRPLFFAFLALIIYFELYFFLRRRALSRARRDLLRHLLQADPTDRIAWVDPLTGLFNKRYVDEMIPRETSRADRRETNLTFLKIDVADFKKVNSALGSEIGDRILTDVAQILKRCFRPSDLIARYGGDEFLVVMPETTKHGGLAVVRRLLEKIEDWNRQKKIPGYKMDLSLGLSTYIKGADVKMVIAAADERLYLYRDKQLASE